MKDAVIKFVKSKTFKALVGVIASALAAYAAAGCAEVPASSVAKTVDCVAPVILEAVAPAPAADAGAE